MFEANVKRVLEHYRQRNILRMEKVGPPARIMGGGLRRNVIFMENPFMDFVGTWTERGGRMLAIEAKSTQDGKLVMAEAGNLKDKQIEWLQRWHAAGAAVGILWEWRGTGWRFIPLGNLMAVVKTGRRHIKWDESCAIPRMSGHPQAHHDFICNLRTIYPQTT